MKTNEEIERLMRVVAESLRSQWEEVMNRGQSLLTAKQERETALAKIKQNDTQRNRIQKTMFGLGAILLLAITYPSDLDIVDPVRVVVIRSIPFSMITVCLVWLWCLDNKDRVARQIISSCDEIFARLGSSVDSLNCLDQGNPYWDVIDEPQVKERLVRAAYRVLDAQAKFETIRIEPKAARSSVIQAGNWIEHCEGMFDRIWKVATYDFGLELDKGEIFKQASAQLTKDNVERATANK